MTGKVSCDNRQTPEHRHNWEGIVGVRMEGVGRVGMDLHSQHFCMLE